MKTWLKENWFRAGLLAMTIIIVFSGAYYYVVFLPQQAATTQDANRSRESERQTEIFRKECVAQKEENIKKLENIMNICLNAGNSFDSCMNNDMRQILSKSAGPDFVVECINSKIKLIY